MPNKKTLLFAALFILSPTVKSDANQLDVNFSGYVKLDAIYDSDQDQGDLSFSRGLATGAAEDDTDGGFRIHARESRLRLTADRGEYKAVIEGDFFGGGGNEFVSNSHSFRLRHAYGLRGNWLAGQTWSTFMDFMNFPKLLDFGSGPGVSFIRQAQLRYTSGNLSLALENPETGIEGADSTDPLPDVVVKYRNEGDTHGYYIAGLFKSIEGRIGGDTESTTAVGLHAGYVFKTSSKGRLGINIITGAPGRYNQEKWAFSDAIVVGDDLEEIESTSYQLTFKQPLADGGSFNIDYGLLTIDDEFENEIVAIGGYEEVSEFHINRIWHLDDNVDYGIELAHSIREEFSGEDGDNTRLQFSAKYSF